MILNHTLLIDIVRPFGLDGIAFGIVRNVESLVAVRVAATGNSTFVRTNLVLAGHVLVGNVRIGIHYIINLGSLSETDVHVVGDLGFTLATGLGGDDDNTAGSTGTV